MRALTDSILRVACILGLGAGPCAEATILTDVPMQGGMVMPQFAYHASNGSLTVAIAPTVPQLTPLLVSSPEDRFDPADPWYDFLDPSRQGLAFSRRYGFVMDGNSDLLPAGTALWIRKLSNSPGLGFYRYRNSVPKVWEPIFGTANSTNVFQWDKSMFHPCVTAQPGTASLTASFEAFLVNATTGAPVAGANTGPFTLTWTDIPDGRPVLDIAQKLIITWPASTTNYVLETADTLPSANWTLVTNSPVVVDDQPAVILNQNGAQKFFRMRFVP